MRASDVDLRKLKCQKCEFQALHAQQLQEHLSDKHADELAELSRCRCCNFLFFAEDDLKEHFKVCDTHSIGKIPGKSGLAGFPS